MNRFLGIFAVLLILTFSSMAQDNTTRDNQVPVAGQESAATSNFAACQHAWGGMRSL